MRNGASSWRSRRSSGSSAASVRGAGHPYPRRDSVTTCTPLAQSKACRLACAGASSLPTPPSTRPRIDHHLSDLEYEADGSLLEETDMAMMDGCDCDDEAMYADQEGDMTAAGPASSRAVVDRESSVEVAVAGVTASDPSSLNLSAVGSGVATDHPSSTHYCHPSDSNQVVGQEPLATVLDFSSFPHLADKILGYSSRETRLTFRRTSSTLKQRIDDFFIPRHLSFRRGDISNETQPDRLTVYNWGTGRNNRLFNGTLCSAVSQAAVGWRLKANGVGDEDENVADPHDPAPSLTAPISAAALNAAPVAQGTVAAPRWLRVARPDPDAWSDFTIFTEVIDYDYYSLDSIDLLRPFLPRLRVLRVGQRDMGRTGCLAPTRASKAVVFVPVDNVASAVGTGPLMQFKSEDMVVNLMSFPCHNLAARIGTWALPQTPPRRITIVLHVDEERRIRHPSQRKWSDTTPYFHHYEQVFALAARSVRWTTAQVTIVGFEEIDPLWFGAPPDLPTDTILTGARNRIESLLARYRTAKTETPNMMGRLSFITKEDHAEAVGPKEYMLETAPVR